jgi:hypothetical protein
MILFIAHAMMILITLALYHRFSTKGGFDQEQEHLMYHYGTITSHHFTVFFFCSYASISLSIITLFQPRILYQVPAAPDSRAQKATY